MCWMVFTRCRCLQKHNDAVFESRINPSGSPESTDPLIMYFYRNLSRQMSSETSGMICRHVVNGFGPMRRAASGQENLNS